MADRRHNLHSAFTLIELVLAMSMVAIVALSLYTSMKIAFKATASADKAIEPSRTGDLALELLAADIENAVPPNTTITNANNIYDVNTLSSSASTSSNSTPGASSAAGANASPTGWVLAGPFEGTQNQDGTSEADNLVFFTNADAPEHPDGTGEIKMVELTIDTPAGSKDRCLVRKVTGNLTSEQPLNLDEEVLCRGIASLTIQYFDGSQWQTTWDSTQEDNTLPAAVQVTVGLDRVLNDGQHHTINYTRVYPIACSTAALDSNVNTGSAAP